MSISLSHIRIPEIKRNGKEVLVCTRSSWNLSTIYRLLKEALKYIIRSNDLDINTLTMDNGGKNNKLSGILPKEIMYNCNPYCSGGKGTLENKHRIVRRIILEGLSLEKYTDEYIEILNAYINNYHSSNF